MYVIKDDKIKISVRNLVEFICRGGDIDNRNGGMSDIKAMQEGTRIHKKIQKSMGASYHAEVPLKFSIPINSNISYVIMLEGRADGIICDMEEDNQGNKIPISQVTIDEIKTMQADVNKLNEPVYVHKAQALCYGYMYATLHDLNSICVQITYCNPENEHMRVFNEEYSYEKIEKWFYDLIHQFQRWTDFAFQSKTSRQQSIRGLEFPFEYRKGQKEVSIGVYRTIERQRNLYIQAPTGVGKTISTIFPTIKAIGEGHGDKLFYLTAKTITRTVAEDTFTLLRNNGLRFRTVTLTAKDKICVLEERECNPMACEYAKGHLDRINDAVFDIISNEQFINRDKIMEYADKHKVCPFEMSLDISYWCDGIICDYNYVFDPYVCLKRYFAEGVKGDYIFLVDEAHNLVERSREMYSATLIKEEFLVVKKLVEADDKKLYNQLEKCNKDLLELKRECDTYRIIDSTDHFIMSVERLYYYMKEFFENQKTPEYFDVIFDFFMKVKRFLDTYEILDDKYVVYTEHNVKGEFLIKLFCVDPSTNISGCIQKGISTIFFSATLLPITYFKEMLTGNMDDYAIYAETAFANENRQISISKDVSSRYTRRNVNEYRKICNYINSAVNVHTGNYMAFFPSYSYMESVYEEYSSQSGTQVMMQSRSMNETMKEEFLSRFSDKVSKTSLVAFCVIGGIFSEGIDLKHDSLVGAIIVGTGLPMICNERDILKKYFDDTGKNGYEYSYVFPGMNKVLQAAGRVIRTVEDRGVIMLLDDRFLTSQYDKLFPREWDKLYPTTHSDIQKNLEQFWNN